MAKQQGRKSRNRKPVNKMRDDVRGKGRRCGEEEDVKSSSSLNDISWYSRNPSLLIAAGSFPFPYRPGTEMSVYQGPSANNYVIQNYYVPGFMALDWVPSFGNSQTSTDPASIAGKEIYARVRAAYSGVLDADAPDFIPYLGALDSIFTYIGWLKRVYRALSTYTPDNVVLSEGILAACKFTAAQIQDLRANKTRFWQGINELILKSRKFKCPAVMDLFNRHYWMSDNVYADAASTRAQLYIFNLLGVYKIAEVTEVSGGEPVVGLQMTPITVAAPTAKSVDLQLIEFGDSLIRALDAWDDGYTISGYLQRAYDGTPNFTVAELEMNELITAQFVPEVLSQIENSRAVSLDDDGRVNWSSVLTQMQVTQNVQTNAVVSNVNLQDIPLLSVYNGYLYAAYQAVFPQGLAPMLSIRSEAPTVTDSVIASRLQANVKVIAGTAEGKYSLQITAGTEIPIQWNMIQYNGNNKFTTKPVASWSAYQLLRAGSTTATLTGIGLDATFDLSAFDWHPFVFVSYGNTSTPKNTRTIPVGDIHNPTVITTTDLENLHKICLYSELNSFGL